MNIEQINSILNNKEIKDIYYNDKVVWIQNVNNNVAHIGFMDGTDEMDVSVFDLQEKSKA